MLALCQREFHKLMLYVHINLVYNLHPCIYVYIHGPMGLMYARIYANQRRYKVTPQQYTLFDSNAQQTYGSSPAHICDGDHQTRPTCLLGDR